jgi:hypothetical protein
MSQVLAGTVLVVFVTVWLTALVTLLACVFYAIKAIRHARPGVNLWGRDTLWNPANVLLSSAMLTDEGLRYRRKCFKSLGIATGTSMAVRSNISFKAGGYAAA